MKIEILIGKKILPVIDEVANLRIKLFRDFPYLYVGNLEYEKEYLKIYSNQEEALLIVFKNEKNNIVGVATGAPFSETDELFSEARAEFKRNNLDPTEGYYIGEALILPEYQGKFFSYDLIRQIERQIKSSGYHYVCFMTVERDPNDPRRPTHYKDIEKIWQRLNYQKTNIRMHSTYPTLQSDGSIKEVENEMVFWIKQL